MTPTIKEIDTRLSKTEEIAQKFNTRRCPFDEPFFKQKIQDFDAHMKDGDIFRDKINKLEIMFNFHQQHVDAINLTCTSIKEMFYAYKAEQSKANTKQFWTTLITIITIMISFFGAFTTALINIANLSR